MNIDRFIEIINKHKEFVGEEINFANMFIERNHRCKLDFIYNGIVAVDEHGTIIFQLVYKEQNAVKFYDIIEIARSIVQYEEDFSYRFNLWLRSLFYLSSEPILLEPNTEPKNNPDIN